MANNDKSTILEFNRDPYKIDFDEEAKWFFESSPYGSNKDDVLQYIDVLISAKPSAHRYDPVIVRSSDEIGTIL